MPNEDTPLQDHENALKGMATEEFTNELMALLKSRASLIYLICNEEKRMKCYFRHLSAVKGYNIYIWDCYLGLLDLITEKKAKGVTDDLTMAPIVLDKIIEQANLDSENAKSLKDQGVKGNIYILLDFSQFIADPMIERRLKTFANIESMTHIIMVGPSLVTTENIEEVMSVIDFPYPNNKEIESSLNVLVAAVQNQGKLPNLPKEAEKRKEELIKAVSGLTLHEAQMAFAKSIVKHKSFEMKTILK